MDVPIRCGCGALRGMLRSVTPSSGNRCVCYCDDCQSFAYYLGRADTILDARGGTDIFQTASGRIESRDRMRASSQRRVIWRSGAAAAAAACLTILLAIAGFIHQNRGPAWRVAGARGSGQLILDGSPIAASELSQLVLGRGSRQLELRGDLELDILLPDRALLQVTAGSRIDLPRADRRGGG